MPRQLCERGPGPFASLDVLTAFVNYLSAVLWYASALSAWVLLGGMACTLYGGQLCGTPTGNMLVVVDPPQGVWPALARASGAIYLITKKAGHPTPATLLHRGGHSCSHGCEGPHANVKGALEPSLEQIVWKWFRFQGPSLSFGEGCGLIGQLPLQC